MPASSRTVVALALLALLPGLGTVPGVAASAGEVGASRADPAGPRYQAKITRTEHGIPHIVADDWGSLGYGQGYSTAESG